jgi:signal transduction histidine kinase
VNVVGMTVVRGCCTFVWMQDARSMSRAFFERAYHCPDCIAELMRTAKLARISARSVSMERVRSVLLRERTGLLDRWDRQLKAAAAAGFALDFGTSAVLPKLLDALDKALERRFRPPDAGAQGSAGQARRAALQGGLLSDFLFDSMLEQVPEMSATEQRLLSEGLSQAAIEVLVRGALDREEERHQRDSARLARLAHQLRNSLTAARLAHDLLKRRGALAESKAARALEHSLDQLREGIEDTLLDEALAATGLKSTRVKLLPVLRDVHSAAQELGAFEKNVKVVLHRPGQLLQVQADPRVLRPAVRGLLRAGVQVARRGSTVELNAEPSRNRTRVAVEVTDCDKLSIKRLPELPALSFARRAARTYGGSLVARKTPGAGCRFYLELPSARSQ